MTINNIRDAINNHTARSAWDKGVKLYSLELIDQLEESIDDGCFYEDDLAAPRVLSRGLLNGAEDWSHYSWGGLEPLLLGWLLPDIRWSDCREALRSVRICQDARR